jgi:hypothetical protein
VASIVVKRMSAILLSCVIAIANAYCACATPTPTAATNSSDPSVPTRAKGGHASCHGHSDTDPATSHQSQDSHDCSHCTGTVMAGSVEAKATANDLPPVLNVFAIIIIDQSTIDIASTFSLFSHCGLSPPPPSTTLLKLHCSLIN